MSAAPAAPAQVDWAQSRPTYLDLQSLEAEQGVLGGLLVYNDWLRHCDPRLTAERFATIRHQVLFRAIRATINAGQIADGVSLRAALAERDQLGSIGGADYLVELLDQAARYTGQISASSRVIVELAIRRDLYHAGVELSDRALNGDPPGDAQSIEPLTDRLISGAQNRLRGLAHSAGETMARDAHEAAEAALKQARAGRLSGPPTGIYALDDLINGLTPGDLHILAGRPSMGKTAVGVGIALSALQAGQARGERLGALIVSQEMSSEQLGLRMAMALADDGELYAGMPACGDLSSLRKGNLRADQWALLDAATAQLKRLPVRIEERTPLTATKIEALAGRQVDQWCREGIGPAVIVVDYIGLIAPDTDRRGNKVLEIADISARLKSIAKNLGVHVLALCQLNRGVESREEKRPTLSDLRDSGALEQDADIVTFIYRDAYYLEREVYALREAQAKSPGSTDRLEQIERKLSRCQNELELIVAKQRQGPLGAAKIAFFPATSAIRNIGRSRENNQ